MMGLKDVAVVNRKTYSKVVCERRFMLSVTVTTTVAMVLFILAVAMPQWLVVSVDVKVANASTRFEVGIWGEWKMAFYNGKLDTDYHRTQATFSCIGIGLMVASNLVAVYSLRVHRYMYKRLAACLHFVTALCLLIVVEVMVHSVDKWSRQKTQFLQPKVYYSYSTVITWFAFAIYLVAAVIFVIGSRKRKGSRAATQEFELEDRPFELGRN